MKDLSFPTRDQTCAPAVEAQNSNHWATQEFPAIYMFNVHQLCLTVAPPDTKNSNSSIKPLGQQPSRHHWVGSPQPPPPPAPMPPSALPEAQPGTH